MQLNYHEMTMNEPKDSPHRHQQYLIICTIIAAVFIHSVVTAGAFQPIEVENGIFPGGEFVFKTTKRDYAASISLMEYVAGDAGIYNRSQYADTMYTLYLDDPAVVRGRRQRFAAGFLVTKNEAKQTRDKLLKMNDIIIPPTDEEARDLGAFKLWPKLKYEMVDLPSVNAAVLQFPFTDGFVSDMMVSWKVIPALRAYAAEHTKSAKDDIVVISTCSVKAQMCTHYAPLFHGKKFLLKQENSAKYAEGIPKSDSVVDWAGTIRTLKSIPGMSLIFKK